MPLSTPELMEALDSVTSIPIIPFKADGGIDYEGHARNIAYLMENNHLEGGRRRVIGIAGTSLIHHIRLEEQIRLIEFTGERMGGEGVLIAGVVPNPIEETARLVEAQARLPRPPDAYLLMPLGGVCHPEGIYQSYMAFAERLGESAGARFLYYLRQSSQREVALRLLNDSPHFVGLKIGTGTQDVKPSLEGIAQGCGIVVWGIGDRSTAGAELGSRGHTSGINVVFARASDEINNAQRRGDYERARRIEAELTPLEEIRFREGRAYNYAAVVEAMHLGGFDDVAGGCGGPFNPRVPPEVARQIEAAIVPIAHYH